MSFLLNVWLASLLEMAGFVIMSAAIILMLLNPRKEEWRGRLYTVMFLAGMIVFGVTPYLIIRDAASFRQVNEAEKPIAYSTKSPTSQPSAEVISNATRALRPIQERYEQPLTAETLAIMDAARRAEHPAPSP